MIVVLYKVIVLSRKRSHFKCKKIKILKVTTIFMSENFRDFRVTPTRKLNAANHWSCSIVVDTLKYMHQVTFNLVPYPSKYEPGLSKILF